MYKGGKKSKEEIVPHLINKGLQVVTLKIENQYFTEVTNLSFSNFPNHQYYIQYVTGPTHLLPYIKKYFKGNQVKIPHPVKFSEINDINNYLDDLK